MKPRTQNRADMTRLYSEYPELEALETNGKHRLNTRRHVLKLAPKGAIGAEIGAFTGLFSEVLYNELRPEEFFLIDPWEKLHGEIYPNWGSYSANMNLRTAAAKAATMHRAQSFECDCQIVPDFAENWLPKGLRRKKLDWVYLDASHQYEKVMGDLIVIHESLDQDGIIMGDDMWVKSMTHKSEVFYAVRDFTRKYNYEFLRMDGHGQWAIKRSVDHFDRYFAAIQKGTSTD